MLLRHLAWPSTEDGQPAVFWPAISVNLRDAVLVEFGLPHSRVVFADFGGAVFHGHAWFEGTKFDTVARFDGATFNDKAEFTAATFRHKAVFLGAVFGSRNDRASAGELVTV